MSLVQTSFELELGRFNAQIKEATDGMASFDKEADEAKDATKELSGTSGSAAVKVKQLGAVSQATGKDIKAAAKETGGLKEAFGAFTAELNSAFPVIGKVGTAAKTLGRAFTLALGPVGIVIAAVVAGLGLLLKAFFGTQQGADKLAKVTAIVSAVFDRLLGIAQTLGKNIFDAFSNPKKAVEDLWEALKANIVNRITGLIDQFKFLGEVIAGVFELDADRIKAGVIGFGEATTRVLTGVEDLAGKVANGFNQLSEEIGKAADTGARIAEIDKQLRALALARAQNEGRINRELAEQLAIVQDVNKTGAQRAAAGEKFRALQKQLTGFEQQRLDLEIERAKLATSLSDTSDEEKIAIAELISAKEQALADEAAAVRRVNNTINGINKQAADKSIAEAKRVAEERAKAEQEALEATIARVKAQDALDLDVSNRKAALLRLELDAVRKAQNDELLARVAGGEAIADVLQQQGEQRQAILSQIQEAEIGALLAKFDAEFEAAEKAGADTTALAETQEAELFAFKQQLRDKDLENQAAYYEQAAALAQSQTDAERELTLARLDAVGAGANILAGLAKENEGAAKLALGIQKAAAIAQIVIATAAATQAALAGAALNPLVAAGGPAAIAAFAAPTIAKLKIGAGISIATILAQAISGAYEGGIVGEKGVGTKFSSGRDGYLSRVHKGEMIVPAAETARYMPYLEMMRGGKFEEWVAGMQNATAQGGYKDIKVPGFNDRKLVGAMGSVGSLSEQRKQTELLASLNRRMGRRGNKRYVA
jgi:hypothetical protein